jgi:hypothetical protein
MTPNRGPSALERRIGGLVVQARYGDAVAARAREGFLTKFEREVDPDGILDPWVRERRARVAMRAHMLRLAKKSVEARRITNATPKDPQVRELQRER